MLSEQGLAFVGNLYFAAFLGSFAFLVTWEGARPHRLRHVARNLGLFLLVVLLADVVVGGWMLGAHLRLGRIPDGLLRALRDSVPAQLAAGFLALDLLDYGFHRLCHRVRWLWLIHSVHHSDTQLDVSTGLRFHPVEVSLGVAATVGVLTVLGLPLWIEGARAAVMNPLALAQHANVKFPPWFARALAWIIVTPEIHHVHHSTQPGEYNSNYGQMFSFWDRLFGTYRKPEHSAPFSYGLPPLGGDAWQSLAGMTLTPWRARHILPPAHPAVSSR